MRAVYCVLLLFMLTGCNKNEVGDVSLGVFTTKDIKLDAVNDPIVTGVTCHVSSIEANLNLSDPSDSSIACRQTGPTHRRDDSPNRQKQKRRGAV